MIVIDAAVLTDALVDDGHVGTAARSALAADPHWAAPSHLLVEVVSAIRGKALGGKLSATRAAETIAALPGLVIEQVDPAGLVERMWQLRGNVTAYDAACVAAAEALGCPFVTADARLARTPGIACEVQLLAVR